jgi:hypothetical protein
MLSRAVAAVLCDPEVHVEGRAAACEGRDDLIGVRHLDLGRPGDVAGGHRTLVGALGADVEVRAGLALHLGQPLQADALEVENDLDDVLADVVIVANSCQTPSMRTREIATP